MRIETLVPAYGRDYKSAKAVKADFAAGKDFLICNLFSRYDGKPCNLQDLRQAGFDSVQIRFSGNRKVAVVEIKA